MAFWKEEILWEIQMFDHWSESSEEGRQINVIYTDLEKEFH